MYTIIHGECELIHKDQLKNKYVTYLDRDGKYRTHKVTKITGKNLTVKNALGERHRIHPGRNKIFGRQLKNKIEEIIW